MPKQTPLFKLSVAAFLVLQLAFAFKVSAQTCPTNLATTIQVCEDPAGLSSEIRLIFTDGDAPFTSPPYTYILFNLIGPSPVSAPFGTVTVTPNANGVTFGNVPNGTYVVTVNRTPPNCNVSIGGFGISVNSANAIALNKTADFGLLCNGDANATGTFTASGGTAPYNFTVNSNTTGGTTTSGATTLSFSGGNQTGSISVTVTDAENCSASATINVTEPTVISPSELHTNPSCNGLTDGAINVSASGGTGTLEYSINGGTNFFMTSNFPGLPAGSYSVVVRDANGCLSTPIAVTLTNAVSVTLDTYTATSPTCNNGTNGSITFDAVSGGTGPYTYSITGGAPFQPGTSFTNLPPGNYSLVVRDNNGCLSAVTSATINNPPPVTLSTSQSNVSCFGGNNGSITVTASGGTGPYEFSNNNGTSFTAGANPFTFNTLTAAGYNIVVRDANNCTSAATLVTITQPTATLSFTTSQTNVSCFGGSNGSITVTASGGTGPYEFSSNNGTSFTAGANPFVFGTLTASGYNIIVRDANLCTTTATLVTITQPAAAVSFTTSKTDVSCFGGNNGSITITASGGTAPYQFSRNNGTTFVSGTNPFTFINRPAGNNNIVVRDVNGCTTTATLVTITQPAAALSFTTTQSNVTCFGGNDGSITVTASGGTGPYQFSNNNGTSYSPGANPFTFSTLTAAGYNIRVRDANNCTTTATLVTLTQPASGVSFITSQSNVTCFGGNDGSITVTASGGSGPYEFSSNNGTSFTAGTNPFIFNSLTAGGYNIVVRDANNCSSAATLVTITQPAAVLSFSATQANVSCFGGNDGSITVTAAGGTGPYEFSNNNGISFTAGANPFAFNSLTAAGYNVIVRDANNCTSAATLVTITQPASALSFTTSQSNVTCFGGSDGSITVTASGGTGPYEFSSNNGTSFTAGANPFTFNALTAAGYNIIVRDANNCTTTASLVTISQPATGVGFSTTQSNVSCFGGNNGSITVTASGGTGPYEFSSNNGTSFTAGTNPFIFNSLTAGGYNIVVRDVNNCTSAATFVTITEPATVLSFSTSQSNVSCFGGNDGSITVTASGGTGPYEFSNNNGTSFAAGASPFTFNNLTAGGFNIVVRDANNCTTAASLVTITEPASFTAPFTQTNVTCFGNNDGTITVTPAGGVAPFDFSNDGGATFAALDVANHTFINLTAAVYNIVVRDANNCTATATVTIIQPIAALSAPFTQSNVSCFGGSDGSITINPAGGTGPYDFSIDNGAAFSVLGAANHVFTALNANTYDIVVRDANGCTIPTTVSITQPATALTSPFAQTNVTCFGGTNGSITVTPAGGTGPYDFSIDAGATFPVLNAASNTYSNLAAATYTIVVRDANNCTVPVNVTITQPLAAVVISSATKTDATCLGVNNGSIQINSVTGGTPVYQYSIDNGTTFQASNTFSNLAPATYDVVARDNNGCVSASVQVVVGAGVAFAPSASFTNASCSGVSNGSIQVISVSGGTSPYNYSIDNGLNYQVSNSFTGLAAGSYDVVAKDNNGCISSTQVLAIGTGSAFDPQATPVDASCSGVADGSITVTGTTGGTGPFEYSRDNGTSFQASNIFNGLASGNYNIVVRDANTCISTTLVVTVGTGLTFDPQVTPTDASCSGVSDGIITVTGTTGGTGPFEYSRDNGTTFQVSNIFNGLAAGNYDIVVRDANTCISTTLVVVVGTGLTFDPQATPTDASCSGVNDGVITVTGTTGGTGPFEYSSDNGTTFQVSNIFNGLAAGNYNVVVRDANTCISTSLVVTIGTGLTFDPQATPTDASCSGVSDGVITVTGTTGGTGPFEYSNDNGTTFQVSNIFNGLASGDYDVVVRDANTCISTTLVVTIGTGLTFDPQATPTAASCSGVNNGSITVTGTTGGTGPFEYSNDNGATFQVSNIFNGLASGNYDIVVRDANACLSTVLVVNVGTGASFDPQASSTAASCPGINDGTITVTGTTGGTGPFEYSIDNGTTYQVSNSFTGLATGNYNIVVRDANTCVSTTIVENVGAALSITTNVSKTDATCLGNDGSITINTVTGGTGPYQYSINNGTTFQSSNVFNPVSVGNYNVLVEDANGCRSIATAISILLPGGCGGANCFAYSILPNPATIRPSCGGQDDGVIVLDVSGSVAGNYIMNLTMPGDPLFNIPASGPSGTYSFPNLSSGDYQFTITDAAGNVCVRDISNRVQTTVDAEATGFVDAACFGEASGRATITILSGGASPFDYSIDGTNWITDRTSPIQIDDLPPNGTYSILVRNDATDQCPDEVIVTIGNGNSQIDIGLGTTSATCGASDGAINVVIPPSGASGGPYAFVLDGNTFAPGTTTFPDLVGGLHTLIVEDQTSGCTREIPVTVPFPGLVATGPISFQQPNDCDDLGRIVFEIINPGATTYEIGITTDFFNEPAVYESAYYIPPANVGENGVANIIDLQRGNYYIWLKPSTGQCTSRVNSDPIFIGGPFPLTFEIGCRSSNGDLELRNIFYDQSAQAGNVTFDIFGGPTDQLVSSIDPDGNATISGNATGSYQIRLKQDQLATAGCVVESDYFSVPTGAIDFISVVASKSFPDQPSGSFEIKIQESGSEPYNVWLVESGIGFLSDTIQAQSNPVIFEARFSSIPVGSYTVYVEDARECRKEMVVEIPLDGTIFIPNIFTPNNDNVNDKFYVRNLPDGSRLVVTNRWGKEVYASGNYSLDNLWDGTGAPDGVYFYRLEIKGGGTRSGWVEVLRGTKP